MFSCLLFPKFLFSSAAEKKERERDTAIRRRNFSFEITQHLENVSAENEIRIKGRRWKEK